MIVREYIAGAAMFIYSALAAANQMCFEQASHRYGIPASLLRAISSVESGHNPQAVHKNKNGTYDIGHMQINTTWLPRLEHYGINEQVLLDPCVNTHVGAWILAQNIQRHGYTWHAVGAYNTTKPKPALVYMRKVASAIARDMEKK